MDLSGENRVLNLTEADLAITGFSCEESHSWHQKWAREDCDCCSHILCCRGIWNLSLILLQEFLKAVCTLPSQVPPGHRSLGVSQAPTAPAHMAASADNSPLYLSLKILLLLFWSSRAEDLLECVDTESRDRTDQVCGWAILEQVYISCLLSGHKKSLKSLVFVFQFWLCAYRIKLQSESV